MLMKYDFILVDKVISWKYLIQFYNCDKRYAVRSSSENYRVAYFPTNFEKNGSLINIPLRY